MTNHTVYDGDRGLVIAGAAMHRGIGGEDTEDATIEGALLQGIKGTMDAVKNLISNRKHPEKDELKGKKDYDKDDADEDDDDFDEDDYDVSVRVCGRCEWLAA